MKLFNKNVVQRIRLIKQVIMAKADSVTRGLCLCLLILLVASCSVVSVELEGLSDDSFAEPMPREGAAHQATTQESSQHFRDSKGEARPGNTRTATGNRSSAKYQLNRDSFTVEFALLALIIVYAANVLYGLRENKRIALAFSRKFACPGSILDTNFSVIGPKEASVIDPAIQILRESPSEYKMYASGRRYCTGMLTTIHLRQRPDLFKLMWDVYKLNRDYASVEVYMNAPNWPPVTMAVAAGKHLKAMREAHKDIENFASPVNVSKERLPSWPAAKPKGLQVLSESSTVFYDVFSDSKLQSLFSSAGLEGPLRHFRSLHISTDTGEGQAIKVIRYAMHGGAGREEPVTAGSELFYFRVDVSSCVN